MFVQRDRSNMREVSRGSSEVSVLPTRDNLDVPSWTFQSGNVTTTVDQFLQEIDNDSFIVMRNGEVVHESYRHGQSDSFHQLASMSKSVVGVVASMMIDEGLIDSKRTLADYVPTFAGCAYGETTVAHLLDMRTKIKYEGREYDQLVEATRFFGVVGLVPKEDSIDYPADIRSWMQTSQHEVEPGVSWRYENGNTEAVAEVMMTVSGRSLSELISDRLWSRFGAETVALWQLDSSGREMASGGLSMTLRDVARLGELLRNHGTVGEQIVVPAHTVQGLRSGLAGDVLQSLAASDFGPALPGYGYHHFWWLPPKAGTLLATGRFGQHLYVSENEGVTIAMLSSAASVGFKMYGDRLTAMLESICENISR